MTNETVVLTYLKDHPEFLNEHPELLELMHLPGEKTSGTVVDFQSIMLEKLKADKNKVTKVHKELIENARANMSNQTRIHTAILVALEAESFEELVEVVTQDLPVLLDIDTINIVIESSDEIPFVKNQGIRFVKEGAITRWLSTGDALLQSDIHGDEELFGAGAGLVRSQALIRLEVSEKTPFGLIAFGSRNPQFFYPDQAVDQAGFLIQVIERLIRIWLGIHS